MSLTCIFGNEDYRDYLVALTMRTTHKAYNLLSGHILRAFRKEWQEMDCMLD